MNNISQEIIEKYKIRHTKAQKAEFRDFIVKSFTQEGENVSVQSGKSSFIPVHNIIIGDLNRAEYLVTAHYDTPNTSFFPVIMFADSFWLSLICAFLTYFPVILAGCVAGYLTASYEFSVFAVYTVLILGAFTFTNKNNLNDNTSGVVSVLEIFYSLPKEIRDKGAFVLFDNEEKGLIGSGFLKTKLKNKKIPVYNIDCVGDGDDIRLFAKKSILDHAEMIAHSAQLFDGKEVKVSERALRNSIYMSDDYIFDNAICFAAFRSSFFGKYISRIHSNKDTNMDEGNIKIIIGGLGKFLTEKYTS